MSNTFTSIKVRQIFSFVIHLVFDKLTFLCPLYFVAWFILLLGCFGLSRFVRFQSAQIAKYAHVPPILKKLHWLPVKYRCIFKTATLVYKLLHSGSPSYFEPFLSFSSCPYSTRHSHPDRQYLTVPPFLSSVFKSAKHFGHSFAFDAPKIWNELKAYPP